MLKAVPHSCADGVLQFLDYEDDYVSNYEQIAGDDLANHLMPDEVKDTLANLCDVFVTGGRVLDVGCAYGHVIGKVRGDSKVGLDISQTYLKTLPPDVLRVRADAERLPFQDGWFDYTICTDVFEHVRNPFALSNELERVTRPGGMILLAVPWEQDLSVYDHPDYPKRYKYVHLRSVNDGMIRTHFGHLKQRATTLITHGMKHMKLKPYPIRFFAFER